METIQITVSDSLMAFLRERAKKLGFATPSDYVVFILEVIQLRETERKKIEDELPGPPGRKAAVLFWDEIEKVPRSKRQ